MNIRLATEADAPALLRIYAQYIPTTVTFEYVLPAEAEFAGRIREITAFYPYLVCEEEGRLVGYAYAHRLWARAAYQWNAELTVYLDAPQTRRGLGKLLYGILIELLGLQGIHKAFGIVAIPNSPSEAFHAAMGFRRVSDFRNVGFKNGQWLGTGWYEWELPAPCGAPVPPRALHDLPAGQVEGILKAASDRWNAKEKTV